VIHSLVARDLMISKWISIREWNWRRNIEQRGEMKNFLAVPPCESTGILLFPSVKAQIIKNSLANILQLFCRKDVYIKCHFSFIFLTSASNQQDFNSKFDPKEQKF
jgi:hypothetical protein